MSGDINSILGTKSDNNPAPAVDRTLSAGDAALVGIAGWLSLLAIGFVLGPIVMAGDLIYSLTLFSAVERAGYAGIFTLEFLVEAGLLAFFIYAATRFFGKKQNAPSTCIAVMIVGLVSSGVLIVFDIGANAEIFAAENGKALVKGIISAAIWIPYFRVSKRVKLTFVN